MPIALPPGVAVEVHEHEIRVKGPKGELKRHISPDISVAMKGKQLLVTRPSDEQQHRSLHGLTRTLVANMVEGVTSGFEKKLEVVGVGFRAEKVGDDLVLRVGFTHTVVMKPRPGITFTVDAKNVGIAISGIDKEAVGQTAAEVRRVRPPDAYKGKGIRYAGEVIKLKAGKSGKAVGGKK
jgi:large subunit ribosomal protein L6